MHPFVTMPGVQSLKIKLVLPRGTLESLSHCQLQSPFGRVLSLHKRHHPGGQAAALGNSTVQLWVRAPPDPSLECSCGALKDLTNKAKDGAEGCSAMGAERPLRQPFRRCGCSSQLSRYRWRAALHGAGRSQQCLETQSMLVQSPAGGTPRGLARWELEAEPPAERQRRGRTHGNNQVEPQGGSLGTACRQGSARKHSGRSGRGALALVLLGKDVEGWGGLGCGKGSSRDRQ